MKKNPMRVLLVGFGNVARKMAAMLTGEREKYPGLAGLDMEMIAIFTGRHGGLVDPAGIGLAAALEQFEKNGAFPEAPMPVLKAVQTLDYDVLVELSTLDIEKRGDPAVSHVRAALERGKHAVTANKGPAAFAFRELDELAHRKGVRFLFESAVMDGTPIFCLGRALPACRVTGFSGIFNTTSNFVLSRLEAGESMAAAVRTAQSLGFAEADPRLDIDGWDSAAKTAILANFFLAADTDPQKIAPRGIGDIKPEDIARAAAAGKRLKLVCRAWREGGSVRAEVRPQEVPAGSYFSMVNGRAAALRLETDMLGPFWFLEENPDLKDTASGVLQDLVTVVASR
ncbi:MAG: homoserine dehydrogenase [Candidatus Aminicenantes bacterium]|nr:homoserine dehydrogenase [Candidatus Aminicenantes bacterium]